MCIVASSLPGLQGSAGDLEQAGGKVGVTVTRSLHGAPQKPQAVPLSWRSASVSAPFWVVGLMFLICVLSNRILSVRFLDSLALFLDSYVVLLSMHPQLMVL